VKKKYRNKRVLTENTLKAFKAQLQRRRINRDYWSLVDVARETQLPLYIVTKWKGELKHDVTKDNKYYYKYWKYRLIVDAINYAKERYIFYFMTSDNLKVDADLVKEYIDTHKEKYEQQEWPTI